MARTNLKPLYEAVAKARRFYGYYKFRKVLSTIPERPEEVRLARESLALYRRGLEAKLKRIWLFPPLAVQKSSFNALCRVAGETNMWSNSWDWPRARPEVDPRLPWAVTLDRPRGPYFLMLPDGEIPKWTRGSAVDLEAKLRRRKFTSMTAYEYLLLSHYLYALNKDHRWDGLVDTWLWLLDTRIDYGPFCGSWNSAHMQQNIYCIMATVKNTRRGGYPTIVVPLGDPPRAARK